MSAPANGLRQLGKIVSCANAVTGTDPGLVAAASGEGGNRANLLSVRTGEDQWIFGE